MVDEIDLEYVYPPGSEGLRIQSAADQRHEALEQRVASIERRLNTLIDSLPLRTQVELLTGLLEAQQPVLRETTGTFRTENAPVANALTNAWQEIEGRLRAASIHGDAKIQLTDTQVEACAPAIHRLAEDGGGGVILAQVRPELSAMSVKTFGFNAASIIASAWIEASRVEAKERAAQESTQ